MKREQVTRCGANGPKRSANMRIVIDLNRCQGYAQCVPLAPDVLKLHGEEAVMYDPNPEASAGRSSTQSKPSLTGYGRAASLMSAIGRYCCKSRFVRMIKNSAGRRFGFRVRMRGTSSPHVKRIGDFGNATEGIRIGDQFPSCVFAKNSEPCNFRLLQHGVI